MTPDTSDRVKPLKKFRHRRLKGSAADGLSELMLRGGHGLYIASTSTGGWSEREAYARVYCLLPFTSALATARAWFGSRSVPARVER